MTEKPRKAAEIVDFKPIKRDKQPTTDERIAEIEHHLSAIASMKHCYLTKNNAWVFADLERDKPAYESELKDLLKVRSANGSKSKS